MNETIAAISTPQIPGAIGIIRISGKGVLDICERVLTRKGQELSKEFISSNPRKAIYCDISENSKQIDQIIFIYFPGPNSYTGEDIAEFSLHGNPILLKSALKLIFNSGARPAREGEFTRRAFLNGKIDLTSAEAISRLISARSHFELELAQKNAFGELHRLTSRLRSDLINLKAECEAEIDFSTEDLTFESLEERKERIRNLSNLCKKLINGSNRAHSILDQFKIVIYGEPNTGKSSLMNCILGRDRAIVSDIPGTTRDFLSENIFIDGLPLQLIDTAGIRDTEDILEKLGIERSEREFESANIRLIVIDISKEFQPDSFFTKEISSLRGAILVANKIDIAASNWNKEAIKEKLKNYDISLCEISCKTKQGIDELIKTISEKVKKVEHTEDYIFLEERNLYHFEKIFGSMNKIIELMDNSAPAEIYIKEIDYSLDEIGRVNGKVETEEILGRIFSKFCVGK